MPKDSSTENIASEISEAKLLLLLEQALDLPAEDVSSWLQSQPIPEAARHRLARMLSADVTNSLRTTALQSQFSARSLSPGEQVGAFEIVRLLGSGGMGHVYLGRRIDGEFEQEVAIKLLQPGRSSGALEALFRNERQILASLAHPNIAALFDGGQTSDGAPFVIMEYVDGTDIAQSVRDRNLSVDETLRLFTSVCEGVAAAHSALVIHRDIKPGNILVTRDGVPKLLDFGIAGNIDANAGDITSAPAMTPSYASPEQLRGQRLTTRSDIYSLGALLFELLTNEPPYGRDHLTPVQVDAQISGGRRPRPSERCDAVGASDRGAAVRGDIDAIVAKAMAEQPVDRYGSAGELIDDIQRHLNREPVRARPDSHGYRIGRFVRRNAAFVTAGAAVVAAIAIGLVVSVVQTQIAQEQRDQAELRFNETRALVGYLMNDLYQGLDSISGGAYLRSDIAITAKRYLDGLVDTKPTDPALLLETARGYRQLGDMQASPQEASAVDVASGRESYEASLQLIDLAESIEGRNHESAFERAMTELHLARMTYQYTDDYSEWQAHATRADTLLTRLIEEPSPQRGPIAFEVFSALVDLRLLTADGLVFLERFDEAAPILQVTQQLVAEREGTWPEEDQNRAWQVNLARLLATRSGLTYFMGETETSLSIAQDMVSVVDAQLTERPEQSNLARGAWIARSNVARAALDLGQFELVKQVMLEGVQLIDAMQSKDPGDAVLPEMRAESERMLAEAESGLENFDLALATIARPMAFYREQFEARRDEVRPARMLADTWRSYAMILTAAGEQSSACLEWGRLESHVLALQESANLPEGDTAALLAPLANGLDTCRNAARDPRAEPSAT